LGDDFLRRAPCCCTWRRPIFPSGASTVALNSRNGARLAAYVDFSAVRESLKQQFRAALHRSQNNDQTKHKKVAHLLTALGSSLSELQIHKRLKMSKLLRASRQFGTACIGREPRMLFSPGRETSPWTLMKRGFAFGGKAWVVGSENSTFDWMGKKPKKLHELRSPHANGPALRKSNKKGRISRSTPFHSASSFSLAAFGL
jgi:Protein of unknown function (DUF2939)